MSPAMLPKGALLPPTLLSGHRELYSRNSQVDDVSVPQQIEESHTYIPDKSRRWLFQAPPPVPCCPLGDLVTPRRGQFKVGASVQPGEPKIREYVGTFNRSPIHVAMGREMGAIGRHRRWGGCQYLGFGLVALAMLICLSLAAVWCWAAPSAARHSAFWMDCMFVSEGFGSTCKRDSADHSLDGGGTATVLTLGPQTHCEQRCLERTDCSGYEYRAHEKRCELWHVPVGFTKLAHHPKEFECKAKLCNRQAA